MSRRTEAHRLVPVWALVALLFAGCNYARMSDDEAINTYQEIMPEMPAHTVPTAGGFYALKDANPRGIQNPLPFDPRTVEEGRIRYGYYCVHCHGPDADGNGTVGQSFSPLPTDLKSPAVQHQTDGELFHKISFGYRRHPPLAYTVAEDDRWAIILYLRSLTGAKGG